MRKQFSDNSIYDVTIPLVIFNYPQTVSSVTVDFEGKDMTEVAEQSFELARLKAEELVSNPVFAQKFKDFTPIISKAMTLHRHP